MAAPRLHFKTQHWVALAGFLTALSSQIATHHDWQHLTTPASAASLIGMLAAFIVALLANKQPESTRKRRDRILAKRYGHPPLDS